MNEEKLTLHPQKYRGGTVVISARIPRDLLKSLDTVADKTRRTRNEIIQLCLEFSLDRIEITEE